MVRAIGKGLGQWASGTLTKVPAYLAAAHEVGDGLTKTAHFVNSFRKPHYEHADVLQMTRGCPKKKRPEELKVERAMTTLQMTRGTVKKKAQSKV